MESPSPSPPPQKRTQVQEVQEVLNLDRAAERSADTGPSPDVTSCPAEAEVRGRNVSPQCSPIPWIFLEWINLQGTTKWSRVLGRACKAAVMKILLMLS